MRPGKARIFFLLCLFAEACNQAGEGPRRKDPLIVGQWEVIEIKSHNKIEKAPGLTLYTFKPNNSYSFELDKNGSAIHRYDGYFKFSDNDRTLITDYTIDGQAVSERASILTLNKTDFIIRDLSNNGDTIVMKRRKAD